MNTYISFDIGGTAIKYSVLNENYVVLHGGVIPTNAESGAALWMESIVRKVVEAKKEYSISGVAVASAGIIDSVKGEVIYALPHVPGYTGFKVKEYLEERTGLPVSVINDARSALLAECVLGRGKGYESVLMLTVGQESGEALLSRAR